MKKMFLFIIIFIAYQDVIAQINNDLIINQMERISESNNEENDYSEIIEDYWNLTDNPVDINSDDIYQLIDLKLINIFQLENIKKYRKDYGDILFIEELYEIEGLDTISIEIIKPLICFQRESSSKIKLKDVLRYGKNKILLEIDQSLNKKEGYRDIEDSVFYKNPNSAYLGSPQRIYFRYNYTFRDKIEAGFVLEKDPGEYLFRHNINDSIRGLLGDRCYTCFDFFSFHAVAKDIKFIKTLAIGDYKLSMGQGLTMSSGIALTTNGGSLLRRNKKISASKSANEVHYFRGIASTLKFKDLELTIFFSSKKSDANVVSYDSINGDILEISSLQQSGLHRIYNEISDRKSIQQQLYGLNLSYRISNFQIGYTLHKTDLSARLNQNDNIYKLFYFNGSSLVNQGVDFYYILEKVLLYGEIAMSDNKGLAGLIGVTILPTGYIEFNVLYRNYTKDYQCFYSNAYASGSKPRNEEGIYLGNIISIAPNCKLITNFDFHRSQWIKSSAYSPSDGYEFNTQLNYQANKNTLFFIEYRNKGKDKNTSNTEIYQKYLVKEKTNMIRFHATYSLSNDITLRNRVEYHFNKYEDGCHNSYLIYQDIIYAPPEKRYNLSFRYAIFDTEKGSIYTYENDVLHAFAVGGLTGKGVRTYLVGKVKLWEQLQLSSKIGFTFYDNKNEIGSGLETIYNNFRGDCKLQLIWSF